MLPVCFLTDTVVPCLPYAHGCHVRLAVLDSLVLMDRALAHSNFLRHAPRKLRHGLLGLLHPVPSVLTCVRHQSCPRNNTQQYRCTFRTMRRVEGEKRRQPVGTREISDERKPENGETRPSGALGAETNLCLNLPVIYRWPAWESSRSLLVVLLAGWSKSRESVYIDGERLLDSSVHPGGGWEEAYPAT